MKICTNCKIGKDESEFYKKSYNKDGLSGCCKECNKKKCKEYRENNKDKIKESKKQYYLENRSSIKQYKKHWQIENREKLNENTRKYCKARRKNDPCFKLKETLRARLYLAIRGNAKKGSAVRDLGCSIEEFKLYLEDQFMLGMTWNNYGSEWEIDHIVAFKDINILDEEQLKIVLSYANLRPCWKWANMARNHYNDDKIDFSSPTPKYFN